MSECHCQSHRNEDFERRLERLEHQMASWLDYIRWPREAISDLQRDAIAIRMTLQEMKSTGENTNEEIKVMAANFDELNADLNTLAAGYVAQQAIIKTQADALASADADKAAAVQQAIADDDAIDQAAVDAADAIAQAALNPAPPAA